MKDTFMNRRDLCKLLAAAGAAGITLPFAAQAQGAPSVPAPAGKCALEVMHTRRSYRAFNGQPVSDEDLQTILAAGMNAPSANNTQPWEFVIVREPATKKAIINFIPAFGFINSASVIVFACMDKTKSKNDEELTQVPLSVTCACMSMWLAVEALGYGTTWLSITPYTGRMNFFRDLLKVPAGYDLLCAMPIGVPQSKIAPESRFTASKLHAERW